VIIEHSKDASCSKTTLSAILIPVEVAVAGAADGPNFFDSRSHWSGRAGLGEPLDRFPFLSSLLF